MKRVLVTGASGFIGRQSLAPLVERGFEVIPVSSATNRERQAEQTCRVDLMDHQAVTDLLADIRPTHLLHFAWYAVPGKFWTADENFDWVAASLHLVREFARLGGERVVSAGTCAEYDWSFGECIENATPFSPHTTYGVCKCVVCSLQSEICKRESVSQAWGRIFLLYGPHEHPARLVSSVINSLICREPARCSHGEQIRDFMHVADTAAAFVALLDSDVQGPVNIASGRPVALKDVVCNIADQLNARELVRLGAIEAPAGDPGVLTADTTRLAREVGWAPKYDLASGLEQTIAWWRDQRSRDAV